MSDLVQKALSAKRESKYIEFKQSFDTSSTREWCEIIKDIVSIANSGGGVLLFGVDSHGNPCSSDLSSISALDPADVANKISKYIGPFELAVELRELTKDGENVVAFIIHASEIPLVFCRPGTYPVDGGKQQTAFSVGTVYYRHGAKSEPGTTDDLRKSLERQINSIRKSWIKGVRKVVRAPHGAQVLMVAPSSKLTRGYHDAATIRAVKDEDATPVYLTRDSGKASGVFLHEQLDKNVFNEINNVICANSLLSRDGREFVLGEPVYYRIYSDRQYVEQSQETISSLLHCAFSTSYVPFMFWISKLPSRTIALELTEQYLRPKSPYIISLLRTAILLGDDFCDWLFEKLRGKWKRHAQPPSFYWTFKKMLSQRSQKDPCLIATRKTMSARLSLVDGVQIPVKELMDKPDRAAQYLSETCMGVSNGHRDLRSTSRELDIFAYGSMVSRKSNSITRIFKEVVGDQQPGNPPDMGTRILSTRSSSIQP